jgi:hypothetical protein
VSNIKPLQDLCHWELKSGSHEWPGPDGGTCINEAALVVAGFEYREINGIEDLPSCFSPVLGWYLVCLNDDFDDVARQKLKRFLLRLSGSADTEEVEWQRFRHLQQRLYSITGKKCDYPGASKFIRDHICFAFSNQLRNTGLSADMLISFAEEAFAIGKQADPLDSALVQARIAQAKASAKEKEVV